MSKTKLQEEIDKQQWPDIDKIVRGKINEFFDMLSDHIEHSGNEIINDEGKRLALADSVSKGEKAAEIENFNKELKIISN